MNTPRFMQSSAEEASTMGVEYVRSLHGIVTSVQVVLGFVAMFASSFIWDSTNVYIQLGYKGYGWQTLILAVLLLTFIVAFGILALQVTGHDVLSQLGKFKLLILYAMCLLLLIIAASLESWYAAASIGNALLHARFIIVTILCWLLVLSYIFMILITLLFS